MPTTLTLAVKGVCFDFWTKNVGWMYKLFDFFSIPILLRVSNLLLFLTESCSVS